MGRAGAREVGIRRIQKMILRIPGILDDSVIQSIMRRLSVGLAALLALSACAVDEQQPYKEALPFEAQLEQWEEDTSAGSGTRTYVVRENDINQIHWTAGDAVSIFFSTYNEQYVFAGETGDTAGRLDAVEAGGFGSGFTTGFEVERYYAIYPYAAETSLSGNVITFDFPATQTYAPDSFGPGAGVMTAVTSGPDDRNLIFKNVTGYLKLRIYGGEKLSTIVLSGNNGEILSGSGRITAAYGEAPATEMTGNGMTLTLSCGKVETGVTAEEATEFWLALPPTDFTEGLSVEITDKDGRVMTQSTSAEVNVRANHVVPMAAFKFKGVKPEPEMPDLPAVSSTLPVLYVYTPDNTPIVDKENWIGNTNAWLKDKNGTVSYVGSLSIRGRGNSTWGYAKKPYALKFDEKTSLLGFPKDKRWNLLANYLDRTRLRNDIALEMGRRLPGLHWTPKGDFVELVLNGVHLGNYYLCEHIKIASDRVNIKEMKATDTSYETGSITGGYLMEMSLEYDETNKFLTNPFPDLYYQAQYYHQGPGGNYQLPVMIKSPEDDVMVPEQLAYITNFINGVQDRIVGGNPSWVNDVDLDSFVEWMLVQEIVGNNEPVHPKSSYMYKDRDGALVMGPLWDFDYHTFTSDYTLGTVYNYSIWYGYMLRYPAFARRMKMLWPQVKAAFLDVKNNYIPLKAASIEASVGADLRKWPMTTTINGDEGLGFVDAVSRIMGNLNTRVEQMDNVIGNIQVSPETVTTYSKVLFLGNSITLCPPSSMWWGTWGMAATRPENDYVHRVMARLREIVPTATYDISSLGGWEVSTDFYHPVAYAPDVLLREGVLHADTDLVIFRLGENVKDDTNFQLALVSLINYVKEVAPSARIVVTGQYWTHAARELACRNAATQTGATYVQINQYDTPAYQEQVGNPVYGDDGFIYHINNADVARHPSDLGMEKIAEEILNAILPAS